MDISSRPSILFAVLLQIVYMSSPGVAADCATKFKKFPGHTACLSKSPDATSQPLSGQEQTDVLNKHNNLRAAVTPVATNMLKLHYDTELEMLAQNWADSCPISPSLSHDKNHHRYVPGKYSVGQNMGLGHSSFDATIQAWYDEVKDYTYGNKKSTFTKTVGHYTQVVWAKTAAIGCGRATCNNKIVYVCNYAPAGNVGDFTEPYETGSTRGSDCGNKDLCDCGTKICRNSGTLDPSQCKCNCQSYDHTTDDICSLDCSVGTEKSHCGTDPFIQANCQSGLVNSIASACPKTCDICPSADDSFVEPGATTADPSTADTSTADTSTADSSTTVDNGGNPSSTDANNVQSTGGTTEKGDNGSSRITSTLATVISLLSTVVIFSFNI